MKKLAVLALTCLSFTSFAQVNPEAMKIKAKARKVVELLEERADFLSFSELEYIDQNLSEIRKTVMGQGGGYPVPNPIPAPMVEVETMILDILHSNSLFDSEKVLASTALANATNIPNVINTMNLCLNSSSYNSTRVNCLKNAAKASHSMVPERTAFEAARAGCSTPTYNSSAKDCFKRTMTPARFPRLVPIFNTCNSLSFDSEIVACYKNIAFAM